MKKIKKQDKATNPFTVPENYFEEFHEKLMQQLPERNMMNTLRRNRFKLNNWKRRSCAAAIALLLLTGITTVFKPEDKSESIFAYEFTENETNDIIESIFDNYTIDDYNVYCYLTSTDSNF